MSFLHWSIPVLGRDKSIGLKVALALAGLLISLLASGDHAAANGPLNSMVSPDTGGMVGSETSLALDASGNPVVSYYDDTNSDLKVLHCGNPDCSAGNSITAPDTYLFVGQHSSLVLDGSGNPVVSYTDQYLGDLKVLHCGNPDCSAGNSITAPDSADNVGYDTSIVLDAIGNPVVSYFDGTNSDLKVLHCGDATCTGGNTITSPDVNGSVGHYTSLALDASGNPVVSYFSFDSGIKLLHCGDDTCTAGNSIVTVLPTVTWGPQNSSLALDAAGNPVLAAIGPDSFYLQPQLKVIHCGNANCTAANTVAAFDAVGSGYVSLALDGSGNPVVSYWHYGYLKLLRCGDADCTAGNRIVMADTDGTFDGGVGSSSSLELDATGNPAISYFADYGDDLRVLHCGRADCWVDQDKDGCPDENEQQMATGTESSGGLRDYLNPWDYFNPTHDGQNRVDDILVVAAHYGKNAGDQGYSTDYDRTYVGPNAWNLGPPNGQIRIDDVLLQLRQYNHDCS